MALFPRYYQKGINLLAADMIKVWQSQHSDVPFADFAAAWGSEFVDKNAGGEMHTETAIAACRHLPMKTFVQAVELARANLEPIGAATAEETLIDSILMVYASEIITAANAARPSTLEK